MTPFPPLIDYPKRRWCSFAAWPILCRSSQNLYEVNLVTYNGGFHLPARRAFLRGAARDRGARYFFPFTRYRWRTRLSPCCVRTAALGMFPGLPITFSFAVGWGFANYCLSVRS